MDFIPEHSILKYNPDTMKVLRTMYNFDKKEDIDKAIDIIQDWLQNQNHLNKKDYAREDLERNLIYLKGSIERTKSQIDRLCTMRTLLPKYFEAVHIQNDFTEIKDFFSVGFLPKLTPDHYRVFISKLLRDGATQKYLFNIFQLFVLFLQYYKHFDYCKGLVLILDFGNASIKEFMTALNIVDCRNIIAIAMEGFGLRLKGIYILSNSKSIDLMVTFLKHLFSSKIASRIHVVRTLESLHEFVPKPVLRGDYGGHDKFLKEINDDWIKLLTTSENIEFFKEMRKAGTNESLRQGDKFNDQYMGIAGSFRTFTVD